MANTDIFLPQNNVQLQLPDLQAIDAKRLANERQDKANQADAIALQQSQQEQQGRALLGNLISQNSVKDADGNLATDQYGLPQINHKAVAIGLMDAGRGDIARQYVATVEDRTLATKQVTAKIEQEAALATKNLAGASATTAAETAKAIAQKRSNAQTLLGTFVQMPGIEQLAQSPDLQAKYKRMRDAAIAKGEIDADHMPETFDLPTATGMWKGSMKPETVFTTQAKEADRLDAEKARLREADRKEDDKTDLGLRATRAKAEEAAANTTQLTAQVDKLVADPRWKNATGVSGKIGEFANKTIGYNSDRATLQADLVTLHSQLYNKAIGDLKAMSATGSTGIGSLSNQESQMITAKYGNLDLSKMEPEKAKEVLIQMKADILAANERIQARVKQEEEAIQASRTRRDADREARFKSGSGSQSASQTSQAPRKSYSAADVAEIAAAKNLSPDQVRLMIGKAGGVVQ